MKVPVKKHRITPFQDATIRRCLPQYSLGTLGFSSRSIGGGLSEHLLLRSLWKKGYVTPVSTGQISEWTFWKFTRKFFADFPEYRRALDDLREQTEN